MSFDLNQHRKGSRGLRNTAKSMEKKPERFRRELQVEGLEDRRLLTVSFQPAVSIPTGLGPRAVAVGDFNGDNHLDIVVANQGSNTVTVLLGNGDGTFGAALDSAAGIDPIAVSVGDFNADGTLDLAIGNTSLANVSVLLGNGNGTFQSPISPFVGADSPLKTRPQLQPTSVVGGDFNKDGQTDLAFANEGMGLADPGSVSVQIGVKARGFRPSSLRPPVNYPVGVTPKSIVTSDFDGDGNLDLAVANSFTDNVTILLGNGEGGFQTALFLPVGMRPQSIAVGDFNGDGKPDLVTANNFTNNTGPFLGDVSVLINTSVKPDAPLTATGKIVRATPGVAFNAVVASFTDADPNGQVGDYRASINWGDGTPETAGTIASGGRNRFLVIGNHTYTVARPSIPITVTITDVNTTNDVGGSTVTVRSIAKVRQSGPRRSGRHHH